MTLTEPLTPEETRVLAAAALGYSGDTSAARCGIAPRTYRRRLASAQDKLGARSMTHAVALALSAGLIAVETPGGAR